MKNTKSAKTAKRKPSKLVVAQARGGVSVKSTVKAGIKTEWITITGIKTEWIT